MLKECLRKGINFKRAQETLNAGTELMEKGVKEENNSTLDVVQQTKKKVQNILSEYKEIHDASSLWADKQTKVMQELRQSRAEDSPSEEETAHSLSF